MAEQLKNKVLKTRPGDELKFTIDGETVTVVCLGDPTASQNRKVVSKMAKQVKIEHVKGPNWTN